MILALDTSTAACTAALFDGAETCLTRRDEIIGRGHAERLVPMLAEMLDGRRAAQIIVGVGPGSFTGIRVGIAAAYGLAIGWNAELRGLSSLALLAASARGQGQVAAAMSGGHGELFVQEFDGDSLEPRSELRNLPPAEAAEAIRADLVVGSGAARVVDARGWGEARDGFPSAADAFLLPAALRTLSAKPVYARAPDARALEAA
ncbi:tRNA (adenosine(37)-N6)-threonylcarbamoyltransferase complex dimerization subunit type 1 TsaB [Sphingomonas sp. URHD0057]|uniref:tRNA (adenosine(37)-N6)-threonylcarbamoyltransferase complex dimerization subunit type 1 TsaB n=1 Tax=Sphingomonas sp. URHD0057 TaxID=1380389 RepID=UPI00048D178D|nr:tRNA (adenosine(37)-N6)-threonylcarbamoyltransferase complex dimerization subunit type 1 TsaB [Sphingomonas sp. URHD0057]